jgi:glyoxylase-like metal-dependent hydrolase (beta-lactamase superfamily II)
MIIKELTVGPLQTNCYIVGCEETLKGAIIDPGGSAKEILAEVARLGLDIIAVINTHGHVDHVLANREVKQATGAPLMIHAEDAPMLTNPMKSFAFLLGRIKPGPRPDRLLEEGGEVEVGQLRLRVLHTPGHSPGSISLLAVNEGALFSGDALFRMSIGRTDFPGGSFDTLMHSIKDVLFALPDETVVYSGHGPSTTVGFEKSSNPWVR